MVAQSLALVGLGGLGVLAGTEAKTEKVDLHYENVIHSQDKPVA